MKRKIEQSGNLTTTYIEYTWKEALRMDWRRLLMAVVLGAVMGVIYSLAIYCFVIELFSLLSK